MPWRCDGVMFDYGRTLVTFDYPTDELLDVIRRFRPRLEAELDAPVPTAETILERVLIPLEEYVASASEDEVDYMAVYRATWARAGLTPSDGLLYEILDAEQLCWDRSVRLEPGALELLAWLGSRGIRRGICSNAPFPPEMMRRQLRTNGIAGNVDAIVLSSEVGRRKPAPEMYSAALGAMGTSADRTLYVGDRLREDYSGPVAAGMRAVIIAAHAEADLPEDVPTLRSIADLPGLL
ncbi:MAG TPA: HAD family hydrolase [Patescibacteria group bacterium]|nr:HAD family hydrolase [Patescibacteria group bacterium]